MNQNNFCPYNSSPEDNNLKENKVSEDGKITENSISHGRICSFKSENTVPKEEYRIGIKRNPKKIEKIEKKKEKLNC